MSLRWPISTRLCFGKLESEPPAPPGHRGGGSSWLAPTPCATSVAFPQVSALPICKLAHNSNPEVCAAVRNVLSGKATGQDAAAGSCWPERMASRAEALLPGPPAWVTHAEKPRSTQCGGQVVTAPGFGLFPHLPSHHDFWCQAHCCGKFQMKMSLLWHFGSFLATNPCSPWAWNEADRAAFNS